MNGMGTMLKPTEAELAIMQVLWESGPCTVRQVCECLAAQKPTGYTTVLKLLQIMTEKGLVMRDESQRSHVYRPRQKADKMRRHLVRDFVDRVFQGSSHQLVMQALHDKKASPEELAELRALLDAAESDS